MDKEAESMIKTELSNLNKVQEKLQDVLERLVEGKFDLGRARVIKEVANSTVETSRTKFLLWRSLGVVSDNIRLVNKPNGNEETPALPEALPAKPNVRNTPTGFIEETTLENGVHVTRHTLSD